MLGLAKLVAVYEGGEPAKYESGFEREVELYAGTDIDHLLVAEHEDEVVAFARARLFQHPDDAPPNCAPEGYYLSGVIVAPSRRHLGIAKLLTERRIEWAAKRASKIYLVLNTTNRASLALQARMGFKELSREMFYPGLDIDPGKTVVHVLDLA
ncbi:MAG: GNAT superfamily N-acetyltransferase [Planctomycetota bacterium]